MNWQGWLFCGLLAGLPTVAQAQSPTGNGLKADYYDGRDFEKFVLTRHDQTIDFNWHSSSPAPGLPAEEFSVRWTGWLLPPVTGRYILQVSVDDGMRLWLNGRQLLNEWRGQSLSYYQVAVNLTAGQPYALRIDYCQYGWDTRALVSWKLPDETATKSSWRTLWGTLDDAPTSNAIPTRYLFSYNPLPKAIPPVPRPVARTTPVVATRAAARPTPMRTRAGVPPQRVAAAPTTGPAVVRSIKPAATQLAAAHDSARAAAVATRLAAGQAITLRALYFEQGKAALLPAVQASLDTLATALAQRPGLRLEVQGHTDNQGDSTLNRQLSQRRADAVCQYLSAHGVAATRLRAVGYGGRLPVADNRVPDQRSRNRRVVLVRQ